MEEVRTHILLSGPRRSSKSLGALHRLASHAWNCPLGNVSMCGRTQTDNYDGGAWTDLVKTVLPIWIDAGFGMEWVNEPKMDGLSHKMYCEVTNQWGRPCRFQLDSIRVENEVERIYKGRRFSAIYMTELSNFKQRRTFDIIIQALRVIGLPDYEHLFIGDTNPAEEGEDSWIYKLWWVFRTADEEALQSYINPNQSDEVKAEQFQALKELQSKLAVHEFTIDDNPFITPQEKRAIFADHCHNQDLLQRMYYGRWVRAVGESIFSDVFRPEIHVVGDPVNIAVRDAEVLLPEENCSAIGTGWDLGQANNALVYVEKCFRTERIDKATGRATDLDHENVVEKQTSVFKVLDEFIEIGPKLPLDEIIETALAKMSFLEDLVGQPLIWRHVSDRASFEQYDKIADTYEYKQIYQLSDGVIELERGPVKKRGSVQQRVDLVRKLLFQDRLFVSSTCVRVIEMLNNLKKGRAAAIDPTSPYKHAFDALTYYLAMECMEELERDVRNRYGVAQPSGLLLIPA